MRYIECMCTESRRGLKIQSRLETPCSRRKSQGFSLSTLKRPLTRKIYVLVYVVRLIEKVWNFHLAVTNILMGNLEIFVSLTLRKTQPADFAVLVTNTCARTYAYTHSRTSKQRHSTLCIFVSIVISSTRRMVSLTDTFSTTISAFLYWRIASLI